MQELGNTADVTNVDSDLYTSTLLSSLQQISCPTPDMTIDVEDREESEGGDNENGLGDTPMKDTMGKMTETKHAVEFDKSLSDAIQTAETKSLVYTPARLRTLTSLRNSIAAMESDFVSFKMEILQFIQSIQSTVTSNDGEMKDKLTQHDNNSKLRIKNLEHENKELLVSNEKLWTKYQTDYHQL